MLFHGPAVVALCVIPVTFAAHAQLSPRQDKPVVTAEQVVAEAKAAYGPPPPEPKCEPSTGDEIVVCGELEEQSQFRVKSSSELDPTSEEAIDDGLPRAPDVAGPGIFRGPATASGCIKGITCPPPRAIEVDFSALPEAPAGSDADRIGRGLPPLGNDGVIDAADSGALPKGTQSDTSAAQQAQQEQSEPDGK